MTSPAALCFGTAQLGMPYGIANRTGMPTAAQAHRLLIAASSSGLTLFDTARDYGEAEARLGDARRDMPHAVIMTKLSPLEALSPADTKTRVNQAVDASVHQSLQALGLTTLPYLLLHRASHLHDCGGAIWERLLYLRREGIIERLGVSAQNPQEALDAARNKDVECLQLPFNLLDGRYERAGLPALLAKHPDILVIARSALLQGLLTQDDWPIVTPAQAQDITRMLDHWVVQFGRKNRVDLCLAYVRAQSWINAVTVGMENELQLRQNLEMFATAPLSEEACAQIRAAFPALDERLLNPACWPRKGH